MDVDDEFVSEEAEFPARDVDGGARDAYSDDEEQMVVGEEPPAPPLDAGSVWHAARCDVLLRRMFLSSLHCITLHIIQATDGEFD